MDLTEAKIYARLVLDTHAATLEQAPSGYACQVARFVLDLPEPNPYPVTHFDALADAICLAAARVASPHSSYPLAQARNALAADLRAAWPVPRPEPVSPAPGALSGQSGDAEPSDLFADGYSAGRYGTPFEDDLIAALPADEREEWFDGYHRGQAAAEMAEATAAILDERFGDHGSPRGPVER